MYASKLREVLVQSTPFQELTKAEEAVAVGLFK
jgi:hypothetical protein